MKRVASLLLLLAGCGGLTLPREDSSDAPAEPTSDHDAAAVATSSPAAPPPIEDASSPARDASSSPPSAEAGSPSPSTIPAPELLPAPGTYTCAEHVVITDSDPDAVIHYTIDGSPPTASSPVYKDPIELITLASIHAIAIKGSDHSSVNGGQYSIISLAASYAVPAFAPVGGFFNNAVSVTLTSSYPQGTICYTTDGSFPSCDLHGVCSGTGVRGPSAVIDLDETATVKAQVCSSLFQDEGCGLDSSGVSTQTFTYLAAKPTAQPPSGSSLSAGATVTLTTSTLGADIHFTLDGSTPDCTTPSPIHESGTTPPLDAATTIKTVVCKPGFVTSLVTNFAYEVQ